jgi:two-component system, NarL family, nitrate/nitrite response regulator NarL
MAVKVLVLENNPVARGFLCRVVRESFSDSLAISEAADLETARRLLESDGSAPGRDGAQPFRLLLVDLELPEGNGLELLSELSKHPAKKVVTTLYADDEHLFPALQRGADGYLLKEDRFEVLVEELQKIVRGKPPLSPAIARRLLVHFRNGVSAEPRETEPAGGRPAPAATAHGHGQLSPRETEVLTHLSKGFTIKEIASLMGIKWFTVDDHIKSIYKKLDVSSRAEAAAPDAAQGQA